VTVAQRPPLSAGLATFWLHDARIAGAIQLTVYGVVPIVDSVLSPPVATALSTTSSAILSLSSPLRCMSVEHQLFISLATYSYLRLMASRSGEIESSQTVRALIRKDEVRVAEFDRVVRTTRQRSPYRP
jgi:hypothetical protein